LATGSAVVEIAEYAEKLGFDSVWVVDHVVLPHVSSQPYPYTNQPHYSLPNAWPILDPLITLAAIASRTSKVLLGTGVYLLPLRHPVISAKLVASLDVLAQGRLRLGVGLGWIKEEYEVLGVSWSDRGRLFDEQIDLMRVLWRDQNPCFDGEFWKLRDIGFEPKPVNGTVPLLIGGRNSPARRRAAKRGDGWHLIDMEPDQVAAARAELAQDCKAAGRPFEQVPISMYASLTVQDIDAPIDSRQFPLMGSASQIARSLGAYRNAGLDHIALAPRGLATVTDYKRLLDLVHERILPETKR
jgi:probable F420-dependent oxidoreductase